MAVNDDAIVLKLVFIDELIGVPLARQVEFRIDLVPGVALAANVPYHLT